MRDGEDCIALEVQPGGLRRVSVGHAALFEARVRKLARDGAPHAGRPHRRQADRRQRYRQLFRKPYGPGWALTGDAGTSKIRARGSASVMRSNSPSCSRSRWAHGRRRRLGGDDVGVSAEARPGDEAGLNATLAFTPNARYGPGRTEPVEGSVPQPRGDTFARAQHRGALATLLPPGAYSQTMFISRCSRRPQKPAKA